MPLTMRLHDDDLDALWRDVLLLLDQEKDTAGASQTRDLPPVVLLNLLGSIESTARALHVRALHLIPKAT